MLLISNCKIQLAVYYHVFTFPCLLSESFNLCSIVRLKLDATWGFRVKEDADVYGERYPFHISSINPTRAIHRAAHYKLCISDFISELSMTRSYILTICRKSRGENRKRTTLNECSDFYINSELVLLFTLLLTLIKQFITFY